jgi:hypothetical protein
MKIDARVLFLCLIISTLFAAGCNYIKPMMYINVSNQSGQSIRNLEVRYPAGTFGIPELRNGQTHRHMSAMGAPCKLGIVFEDQPGKKFSADYDLGAKCPAEFAFEVAGGMTISERQLRP